MGSTAESTSSYKIGLAVKPVGTASEKSIGIIQWLNTLERN
jgi:hypothetical protein